MVADTASAHGLLDRFAAGQGANRAFGPRALRTRQSLLDTTATLLRELPFHALSSALVSQRAGLSPAAFYRYFSDLGDAIVALTPRMAASVEVIAAQVRAADWSDAAGARDSAAEVVAALAGFWEVHRPLYRVTDLLAEEGDARFLPVKAQTFGALTDAFTDVAQERDPVDRRLVAGIVVTALVHTTLRESGFESAGVPAAAMRATLARAIALLVRDQTSTVEGDRP
jgi:AcrR family transcriptional regulator